MLAIKVFVNGKEVGYVSKENWNWTNNKLDAMTFSEAEMKEVERVAERFEDGYDEDCGLECKIVKWDIQERILTDHEIEVT